MISFTVNLDPVPQGRPRVTQFGTFNEKRSEQFKMMFRRLAAKNKPIHPLSGPLEVVIRFYLRPPQERVRDFPECPPDWDNLAKAVCDAMNPVYRTVRLPGASKGKRHLVTTGFWFDDGQIIDCRVLKLYDWHTRKGRIEIRIQPFDETKEMQK